LASSDNGAGLEEAAGRTVIGGSITQR
jgi:hypothetical protein